jgi:hypothetical protein
MLPNACVACLSAGAASSWGEEKESGRTTDPHQGPIDLSSDRLWCV